VGSLALMRIIQKPSSHEAQGPSFRTLGARALELNCSGDPAASMPRVTTSGDEVSRPVSRNRAEGEIANTFNTDPEPWSRGCMAPWLGNRCLNKRTRPSRRNSWWLGLSWWWNSATPDRHFSLISCKWWQGQRLVLDDLLPRPLAEPQQLVSQGFAHIGQVTTTVAIVGEGIGERFALVLFSFCFVAAALAKIIRATWANSFGDPRSPRCPARRPELHLARLAQGGHQDLCWGHGAHWLPRVEELVPPGEPLGLQVQLREELHRNDEFATSHLTGFTMRSQKTRTAESANKISPWLAKPSSG